MGNWAAPSFKDWSTENVPILNTSSLGEQGLRYPDPEPEHKPGLPKTLEEWFSHFKCHDNLHA